MSIDKMQSNQIVNDAALAVLRTAARAEIKDILPSIDTEFGQPLRLFASSPSDALLNIAPNYSGSSDGSRKVLLSSDEVVGSYVATTINFQTGAVTGGSVLKDGAAFSLPSSTIGQFRRIAFVYSITNNNVNTSFSAEAASVGALADPSTLFTALDGIPIGYVDLEATAATAFKTAGSATAIIENSVSGTPRIFKASASGSGGGSGSVTDFKLQSIAANVATIKKGSIILDDGRELYLGSNLSFDLSSGVSISGITSPANNTQYYLYIDLNQLPAQSSVGNSDRKVYVPTSGGFGAFIVLADSPENVDLTQYIPIASVKTNGSGVYTLYDNLSFKTHDTSVYSDKSFLVLKIADPSATIRGGYMLLSDGRELATFNSTYGVNLVINLDTILGSNPANSTSYYLYVNLATLGAQQNDNGRKVYKVEQANFHISTVEPELIDLSQYVPIALITSASSGNVWSGSGSSFSSLARRKYQLPSIVISPLKQTITRTVESVGASSTQLAGGHVLEAASFPSTTTPSNTSIYNLVNGSPTDAYGSRNLTAAGSPTGDTSILGVANGATALNGSTQYLYSGSGVGGANAFFNAGDNDFAVGGWFKYANWDTGAATQVLFSTSTSGTDVGFDVITVASTKILRFYYPITLSAQGTFDITHGFSNNTWHHIAIKYDAALNTWKYFLDGSLVYSVVQANLSQVAPTFFIGANPVGASSKFTGSIDEFFFTKQVISDSDMLKLFSSKISWTDSPVSANQRIEAEYTYGDIKSQIDSDFIVDKEDDYLYCDFSNLPSTSVVTLKLYDTAVSATTSPVKSYDALFTTTPPATISHLLAAMPTNFVVLHNENADGKYVPLNPQDYLRADESNIYTDNFNLLTIDATHQVRIIAAIASPAVSFSRDFLDNLTPTYKVKTSTYTAVKGDRIFANSTGGAFTINMPSSPTVGDVVCVYDLNDTWFTNNVTLSGNGSNIEGAATFILDENGLKVEVIYNGTQWKVY